MSYSEAVLETLKRIGFPESHKFKPDDFKSMFLDGDLKPILESFCTLTEDNVLSSEELAEYAAISPDELAHLEKLAQKDEAFVTDVSEDEIREEVQFLKQHLAHIEEENRLLQRQKDLLKSHSSSLLEEKVYNEEVLIHANTMYDTLSIQKLPQVYSEMISVLQSISKLILELQFFIAQPDYDGETSSPNLKGAESYLDEENKLLDHIQGLLSKNFGVKDFQNFTLNVPGHQESKLLKEVHFLRKALKNSRIAELEASSEREKLNRIVQFYKKCEDGFLPNLYEISMSELWAKLEKESECNEKLMEKEKLLKLYLAAAIAERVDAQCNKIGIAHSEEVIEAYNCNLEKIQGPLEHMMNQRSRLELVILYIDAYLRKYMNIKQLIDSTSNFLEKEKKTLCERKDQYEEELEKEIPVEDKYLSEDSVFLSIFKILKGEDEHQNLSFVFMDDVFKKVEKMYKEKEYLDKLQVEKQNILDSLEKQRVSIEKLVFQGKEFSNLSEMDMLFNAKLNKMDITYLAMYKTVRDVLLLLDKKQKLLQQNRNLSLARNLYIYALCDEETFHEHIERIKTVAENCIDSIPSLS